MLFINPRSGGGKATRTGLAAQARARGVEPVVLEPGIDLSAVAADAVTSGADALGMAGGDGSMAIVAAVAAEHGIPFVCVPAGTRNHFALDLGVARRDLIGALDAFTDGLERHVDLGEVNRRVFVNNVSIGIYGDAVQQTGYRDAKARTLLETAREVLGPTAAAPGIRLLDDLGRTHADPAVVLVSNNPYAIDQPLACGTRPRLDGGQLGVVVLDRPTEAKRPQATAWSTRSVDVQSPSRVNLGIDGEAVTLESPLRFAVRARALRVRISARHPGVSPSALAPPLPRRAPKT